MEMREKCEACESALAGDDVAYICSYECTWCEACANQMAMTCRNCAGELVPRPRRARA
jgi:hypothetical protein